MFFNAYRNLKYVEACYCEYFESLKNGLHGSKGALYLHGMYTDRVQDSKMESH